MLQGTSLKSPLVLGKEQDGLYVFKSSQSTASTKNVFQAAASTNSLSSSSSNCSLFPSSVANVFTSCSSFFDPNVKENLWHYRLGHIPLSNMKKIVPVSSSCSKFSSPCVICPMASCF